VTNDCERCGTPTDSDSMVVDGATYQLCDGCRDEFEALLDGWLSAEEKPAARGWCFSCDGAVEIRFRFIGHGVEVVATCPECGWREKFG